MTRSVTFALCGLLVAGCGPADGADPQVGGESHFLSCSVTDECPVGQCRCGVCAVTCDEGCAPSQTCVAADDLCAVPLCGAPDGCDETGCAAGLECVEGACRAPTRFSCDGATQTAALDADHDLIQGVLPASREEGCALADAGGPYCDASPGAVYAVASALRRSVWCVPTGATLDGDDAADLSSLDPNSVLRFPAGAFDPVSDDIGAGRVTVLGGGSSRTQLTGPLTVRGSLARLVGLTVVGDLYVAEQANDALLVDVVVTGDLRIDGNNAALIEVAVLGRTQIDGNRPTVAGSRFATMPEIAQTAQLCVGSQLGIPGTDDSGAISVCE